MTNFNQRVNGSTTREEWLSRAANLLQPIIEERTGRTVNAYRIGVGDLGIRTLGLCWAKSLTQDSVSEITITLRHSVEPSKMLGTLVHEMIHAAGVRGHRRDFAKAGRECGLTGKPTGMGFIEDLPDYCLAIIEQLGPFPNPSLQVGERSDGPKPQKARMIKVECDTCGIVWRTAQKWLVDRPLRCPLSPCPGKQIVSLP